MMATGSRIRQVGWAIVLSVCCGLLLALTFRVNAVKSEVRLTERRIIAEQQAKLMLETEFQTRASQQQLADWNAVEFGYSSPRADQYLESETQLAALGTPRGIDAPAPVRVALNTPPREHGGLLAELIAAEEGGQGAPEHRIRRDLAATDLARRLANPTGAIVGPGEVGR
jgi:hypothetical protein